MANERERERESGLGFLETWRNGFLELDAKVFLWAPEHSVALLFAPPEGLAPRGAPIDWPESESRARQKKPAR